MYFGTETRVLVSNTEHQTLEHHVLTFHHFLCYTELVAVLGFTLGGSGVAIIAAGGEGARTYIATVNHP